MARHAYRQAGKLLLLYLAIMLGPLALAIVAWTLRDGLKAVLEPQRVTRHPGAAGREERLGQPVEVPAAEVSRPA